MIRTLIFSFIISLSFGGNLTSQDIDLSDLETQPDTLHLSIVIPEQDYVSYSFSRYRVAANTHPEATAYVNGNKVKVYSNGAFVDMIEHTNDTTAIEFRVEWNGEELADTLYLVKPAPVTANIDDNMISDLMVLPTEDLWLSAGDRLDVQFYGRSGEEAVFNIDGFKRNIPMHEVPEDEAGTKGVYKGHYVVQPGDDIEDRNITFKMKKGLFGYHKRTSTFTVRFLAKPVTGEVIDENAYLNIGMGTDRLGGAKHGSIAQGVMLNIVGKEKGNYKVRLSESLHGWIPERFVELKSEFTPKPESLTGNIRISGRTDKDLITLSLSEKLPYISYQEINPNKIIVDVFGATSNTNWKIKHLSSSGIKDVDWRQVEDDRFRLIIELNHSQNWGYSVGYGWGSQMNIEIRRPPKIKSVINPLEGRTIAVDAGHGGSSLGALGAAGTMEKEVTLEISQKLEKSLKEKDVNVIMTRTDDSYVYMSERREMTLEGNAEILVSIHANSLGYGSDPLQVRGTGSFYKHIAYKPLAEIMYYRMTDLGLKDYGLTGSFNFSLNAPIEFPNVLVETAFLSNPEEEILLTDDEFQQKIVDAIVAGLEEFYLKHASIESLEEMPEK